MLYYRWCNTRIRWAARFAVTHPGCPLRRAPPRALFAFMRSAESEFGRKGVRVMLWVQCSPRSGLSDGLRCSRQKACPQVHCSTTHGFSATCDGEDGSNPSWEFTT